MPVTGLRGRQILDGDVLRNDLNITTSGSAVIRRIIAGTNITISSTGVDTGTGDVTINATGGTGTVTSVGLSLPAIFSITGSPVTTSGTLTATFASQTANTVFAAPNGSAGTPTFRALVAADIPALTLENLPDAWVKRAVRVATTANITLSGTQTIDGIAVVAGDRVLVKNQSTASQNGIYVVAAGAWSRSADADAATEIAGAQVAVDLGTTNGGTTWDTDFKSSDTLGTTSMTWFRIVDTGYTIPVSQGGTGATTLTGVLVGNGTSAVTAVSGTASQLLRRNSGNSAYEFFTHDFASTSGATFTGQIISTRANNTANGAGQIYLNGASGNRIDFSIAGINAPTTTTRSVGTKIVLYPTVSATDVDYAIGIESSTLWFSIPTNTANSFKWYGGTTVQMELTNGNVRIGTGAGVGSGRLTVNAATGGTSLYLTDAVNATLYVTHTSGGRTTFYNGAATAWLQEVGTAVTIGASTSAPSKLFLFNTNDGLPDYQITHQSSSATLNTSSPIIITNTYNNGSNGHNLFFTSTAASGIWEYNITKTWGGILTLGSSSTGTSVKRDIYIYDSGQIRFANYTSTTSFTGTAVGVLAFTSDGSIITIPTPGGGSGITGSGTQNYLPKFGASGTSIGNSTIFDNGTDVGIGTATPTNIANYRTLHIQGGGSGAILYFSTSDGTGRGYIYGSTAETALNAPAQLRAYVAGVSVFTSSSVLFNIEQTLRASDPGGQIQITGGGVEMGLYMSNLNNLLYITDWASGANGFVIDGGNGIIRARSSSANGAYFIFERSTATVYGYIGNSALLGAAGYNGTSELGIRSEGAINFLTASGNPLARMQSTGQLRLPLYTTTTSFTGTAVGVLAFTSDGSIITIATPGGGGSSQWTTNGSDIYYNTGNVGIGATTPSQALHIVKASGTASMIRFDQTSQRTYEIGILASTQSFTIRDVSATANRLQILSTGQFVFNAYTAFNSFSATDAQGILGFDTSGNIISMYAPIYRHVFISGAPQTANNAPANISFFNSSNTYVTKMDLTGKKRARLHGRVSTAGTATSLLLVRYATTFSTTAGSYSLMGSTEIQIGTNTTGHFDSGWINLVAGAKADVFIGLFTLNGDGAADPVVNQVVFEAEE